MISYSALKSAPFKVEAPLYVTKSPSVAPWLVCATVIVAVPLAVKGPDKVDCIRVGVISLTTPSEYTYSFLSVPIAITLTPAVEYQVFCARTTPHILGATSLVQPPIFSGSCALNLTLVQSIHLPSAP